MTEIAVSFRDLPFNALATSRGEDGALTFGVALPASARPSASFARPANTTAYAAGDLVANSTTAGAVVPLALAAGRGATGTGQLLRALLRKSNAGLSNASFRVHLWSEAPVLAAGDNAALVAAVTGAAYLGAIDITMDRAFSDGALGIGVPLAGAAIVYSCQAGGLIYALVEARAAYAPASAEAFTLAVEVVRD